MTKFEIVITLVIKANAVDPDEIPLSVKIPDYGNRYVNYAPNGDYWDITLNNTVEAETAEDAAATISDELREAFLLIDPDWQGLIFEDDVEKIELFHGGMYRFDELGYREGDVDLNKEFKCRECGTKYEHSFCSTDDVAMCRWCSGEEKEAGILE